MIAVRHAPSNRRELHPPSPLLLQMLFLLYCQLPMFKGAAFIYKTFLRELFKKYEPEIDSRLARASGTADGLLRSAGAESAVETGSAPAQQEDARQLYGVKKST